MNILWDFDGTLFNTYPIYLDLIIGDRELDILPGKQLGIKTCLFQNNQPGANYYLSDYRKFFQEIGV